MYGRSPRAAAQPTTRQSVGPTVAPAVAPATDIAGPVTASGGSEVCAPGEADAEKSAFLGQLVYGPQDLAHAVTQGSGIGVGGFQATYIPGVSTMFIRVTGKVQFRDAVEGSHPSLSTQHTDLSNLVTALNALPAATVAQILPFFQWNDTARQEHLTRFNERLAEARDTWQNTGLSFRVDDPAWCDVTAEPMFSLEVGAEGTAAAGDHLQVTVYKEPTASERAEIDTILAASGGSIAPGTGFGIRANAGTNLGSNAPGATGTATDENALQNEMSLSSSDLSATNDPNERGGNNLLKKTIAFGNNVDTITPAQLTEIQSWITRFNDGDSDAANNGITLRGFASSSGDAAYNQALVARRIASVRDAITGAGVTAGRITDDNRGDAEADSVGPDAAAQDNERRVEIRIGSGERQNTVAHELGHVFGLSDEYVEGASPGDAAWQDPTVAAAGAGRSLRENSDNIISMGNTVRPQHYATFAWALNRLTSSRLGTRSWHVV
jgi:outer membrane protein OmpA-like peptidoglycan-associated protein